MTRSEEIKRARNRGRLAYAFPVIQSIGNVERNVKIRKNPTLISGESGVSDLISESNFLEKSITIRLTCQELSKNLLYNVDR